MSVTTLDSFTCAPSLTVHTIHPVTPVPPAQPPPPDVETEADDECGGGECQCFSGAEPRPSTVRGHRGDAVQVTLAILYKSSSLG